MMQRLSKNTGLISSNILSIMAWAAFGAVYGGFFALVLKNVLEMIDWNKLELTSSVIAGAIVFSICFAVGNTVLELIVELVYKNTGGPFKAFKKGLYNGAKYGLILGILFGTVNRSQVNAQQMVTPTFMAIVGAIVGAIIGSVGKQADIEIDTSVPDMEQIIVSGSIPQLPDRVKELLNKEWVLNEMESEE